ncbi:MAG: DNA-formamidopyrimidine glycosylase [Synechococcaceae cyanobacterium]|nr:DNA-formamidopyrimidine glycosylase [Synechococcaceae cyanobacterium]
MPELPEVETVRLGLEQCTRGRTIQTVSVLRERTIGSPEDPRGFASALAGCRVIAWRRRGKYLLADLKDAGDRTAGIWGVHLRMSGQFLLLPDPPEPCPHTRVRVQLVRGGELRFVDPRCFGRMWWVPPGRPAEEVITGLGRMGPEPFSAAFSTPYLRRRLRHSRRAIKTALLDQSVLAGVGNIYADEALFAAGIRPHTPAGRLGTARLERLREALVEVLRTSIGAGGTTFSDFRDLTGTNGSYGGMAWVYRRQGQPCRRCGSVLRRERLGGRSSHWCPTCQR